MAEAAQPGVEGDAHGSQGLRPNLRAQRGCLDGVEGAASQAIHAQMVREIMWKDGIPPSTTPPMSPPSLPKKKKSFLFLRCKVRMQPRRQVHLHPDADLRLLPLLCGSPGRQHVRAALLRRPHGLRPGQGTVRRNLPRLRGRVVLLLKRIQG